MKTYTTQADIDADIKDGMLHINDDVIFECPVYIKGDIVAKGNIMAWDISTSGNISYYAVCIAYENITCQIISGRRLNAVHLILDKKNV